MMQNSSSSSKANKQALSQLKNEVASELGITLKQGYNGDITSREAGRIGGQHHPSGYRGNGKPDERPVRQL